MSDYKIIHGDCIDKLKELEDNSVDAIVTDPPYGLEFMGKDWDSFKKGNNIGGGTTGIDTPFGRKQALPSFYQREIEEWHAFQEFNYKWAVECLRVLKPGGFLFAMGGTRTHHRLTCGIEDAGFKIRDEISWVYGSGFPKAQDLGMLIEKKLGGVGENTGVHNPNERPNCDKTNTIFESGTVGKEVMIKKPTYEDAQKWVGWKTPALKPAFEPIIVAQKPCEGSITENVMRYSVGGFNIDESRVGTDIITNNINDFSNQHGNKFGNGMPIKKLGESQVVGRFPANLIWAHHPDCKENECVEGCPSKEFDKAGNCDGLGSPARFFKSFSYEEEDLDYAPFYYCAKASKSERNEGCDGFEEKQTTGGEGLTAEIKEDGSYETTSAGGKFGSIKSKQRNTHPTVKPVKLMEYLIKLCTREGAVVLDPFMGSGTTGVACIKTNRRFIGIDMTEDYIKIAEARIKHHASQRKII